jgi:hypothetical protein
MIGKPSQPFSCPNTQTLHHLRLTKQCNVNMHWCAFHSFQLSYGRTFAALIKSIGFFLQVNGVIDLFLYILENDKNGKGRYNLLMSVIKCRYLI